ncbi:hypothetical protein F511_25712 [Dorcoceras hygrometricum]|uniref:Uncharacterized protein n=1 Tax=Dorcoceras hygrometricum TaxID=472368 RepID=A0A2Z7A8U0_9LAMI|nr:hypothetical protein F511_25712 [Dorcoceras hygrometricum]
MFLKGFEHREVDQNVNAVSSKENMLQFVYGISKLNLLRLPFFRNGKDPLEDFGYCGPRCNPLLRPAAERTPSNHRKLSPQAVCLTSLLYCLSEKGYNKFVFVIHSTKQLSSQLSYVQTALLLMNCTCVTLNGSGIQLAVGPQPLWLRNHNFGLAQRTCVTLNGSGIQLAVGPQPLWLRNHNFGLAQRIMVKRLATSRHDPLGITDSACKNQLVVVSVQYGPFNTNIPIRSMTIDSIGYPRMKASGESSTTKHRLLHASGPHPIPPPNDPKTNQYNQDLGLINSTNGNHLESPNEDSSIDHQVTIHLYAQNITMFPTNETWYFAS